MRISDWSSDVCSSDLGIIVPGLGGRRLIVPFVLAGLGVDRHDGAQEQVVALAFAADAVIPRRAISSAEIDGVEFGVIGDGVPHGAAAAVFPPFARPALRSDPRRLVVVDAGLARRPEDPTAELQTIM